MHTIINCYQKPLRKMDAIYLGYDPREHEAVQVLQYSIEKYAAIPLNVVTLNQDNLRRIGLYRRAPHVESTCWGSGKNSDMLDCFDERPFSTEFSFTRFLTPMLNQMEGYALFMDSDMFFREDPSQVFDWVRQQEQHYPGKYAVWCVKHRYLEKEDPSQLSRKMYGCPQTSYGKKNWSSFVVWNCSHPSHRALTVDDVNTKPGRWLH